MNIKKFERRFLELAFATSAVLTVPYVAYCLGLRIDKTQRFLSVLVQVGVLEEVPLSNGIISYRLSNRVGGAAKNYLYAQDRRLPLFPERDRNWVLWMAGAAIPFLLFGAYYLGTHQEQRFIAPQHLVDSSSKQGAESGKRAHPGGNNKANISKKIAVPRDFKACKAIIDLQDLMGQREVRPPDMPCQLSGTLGSSNIITQP